MLGGNRERGGQPMAIERIEIDLLKLPYVHFFETSFGRSYDRTFSLVKVFEGGGLRLGRVCGRGIAPLQR